MGDHLDLLVARAVQREDALHPDTVGNLPDREGRPALAPGFADHHSLERLHPLFVALFDFPVDAHGVASSKICNVLAHLLGLNVFNCAAAHDRKLPVSLRKSGYLSKGNQRHKPANPAM